MVAGEGEVDWRYRHNSLFLSLISAIWDVMSWSGTGRYTITRLVEYLVASG